MNDDPAYTLLDSLEWVEPEQADAEGLPCAYCPELPSPGQRVRKYPHPACEFLVESYMMEAYLERTAARRSALVRFAAWARYHFSVRPRARRHLRNNV